MKKEKACGCIVFKGNEILVIKQHQGFYGFPKGHMEKGETEIITALREVKEETNIDVRINEKKRFEMSYIVNNNINKTVIYFIGEAINDNIIIQKEELLEAKWININDVESILTYNNLKELWKDVYIKISDLL